MPARVVEPFLGLVGMQLKGSLDPGHGFVFLEKPGHEKTLLAILQRMYPKKAGIVWLIQGPSPIGVQKPESIATDVWAMFDGIFACVVHGTGGPVTQEWKGPELGTLKNLDPPRGLVSTEALPTKLDILRAFPSSKFSFELNWNDVAAAAKRKMMSPGDVVQLIKDAPAAKTNREPKTRA